jgi:hypothetical protein
MPKHVGLPLATPRPLSKQELLNQLSVVDRNESAKKRALAMEVEFRRRITLHVQSLPASDAQFSKFNTNPFVLMFHSLKKNYRHISEIESDILPAKVFSSMETSAGRMVEAVVLPVYGWQVVPSEMHSANSVLDGKSKKGKVLCLATLKSGPRCLNDEMIENIADAILLNFKQWAEEADVKEIDFTYGVLYGTQRQSNKKDWHILRNIGQKLKGGSLRVLPDGRWNCEFEKSGVKVRVTIRIGTDLWNYIGGKATTFVELSAALIRACVIPSDTDPEGHKFTIADLSAIISLAGVPDTFNVALLQRSQLEWLFFFARHFCDEITES